MSGILTLFVFQSVLCQQWIKTPIKDLATIEFPVPVRTFDTLGAAFMGGHDSRALYTVTLKKLPDESLEYPVEDILKSATDGHLKAEQAQSGLQTEFTVKGYKGLQTWHTASPTIKGGMTSRCMRTIFINGYLIMYEVATFPEYATDDSVQDSLTHFLYSFEAFSTFDPTTSTAPKPHSLSDYTVNELAHKLGYFLGQLFCIGVVITLVVVLFRRLR